MQATQAATKPDLILSSAWMFGPDALFTAESLAVAAWKAHPKEFGLKTYAELYPDANAVLSYLMGEKGLVKQGFLERVAPKTYRLTEKGRERAEALA